MKERIILEKNIMEAEQKCKNYEKIFTKRYDLKFRDTRTYITNLIKQAVKEMKLPKEKATELISQKDDIYEKFCENTIDYLKDECKTAYGIDFYMVDYKENDESFLLSDKPFNTLEIVENVAKENGHEFHVKITPNRQYLVDREGDFATALYINKGFLLDDVEKYLEKHPAYIIGTGIDDIKKNQKDLFVQYIKDTLEQPQKIISGKSVVHLYEQFQKKPADYEKLIKQATMGSIFLKDKNEYHDLEDYIFEKHPDLNIRSSAIIGDNGNRVIELSIMRGISKDKGMDI